MSGLTFHLILHTHWDREWYLPRAAFQARLVPVMGAVIELLEREPDARFTLDGQSIVAEDALDICPEWIRRVGDLVSQRRFAIGPWYILGDELVPAGESLIRNLLQGSRDATALGGRMDVLYSPDAFGHPAAMPAIATQFGIDTGVVWRGLGRPTGAAHDLYRWRGPDGGEILLYHLPAAGYEIGGAWISEAGDADAIQRHWRTIRDDLVTRAVSSHVAVFVGADHHAPPSSATAIGDAIQDVEPDDVVLLSSLDEYFAAASASTPAAPLISGELRASDGHTWALQGTFATRSRLKRRHGAVELYVQRQAEPLAALAAWHRTVATPGLLRATWRGLLQCQFHDTLCGCCSDLVAREQDTRLTSVHAMACEITRSALHALANHDPDLAREAPDEHTPALLTWNPVARPRSGVIVGEVVFFRRDELVGPPSDRVARTGRGFAPFALAAPDGRHIPLQILSVAERAERIDAARHYPDQDDVDRVQVAFALPDTPGLGFTMLAPVPPRSPEPGTAEARADSRHVENRFVTVVAGDEGRIEIVDRRNGERYPGVLEVFVERDDGDTYTPSVASSEPPRSVTAVDDATVLAAGPLLAAIERRLAVSVAGHGSLAIRMAIILFADSPVVRVRLDIDNGAENHRLRVRFPIGAGNAATAGAAFGFERRDPVEVTPADHAAELPPQTAPAQRYVAAGDRDRGLALLVPGFVEYEWSARRELTLTLLRSVGELSRGEIAARPGHAGWPMATPDAQEPGHHRIEFGFTPLGEDQSTDVASLERLWEDTFLPPQATFIRHFTGDASGLRSVGVSLEGQGLVFTACKTAENGGGTILRCYNTEPATVDGCWRLGSRISTATLVRADETPVESLVMVDPGVVRFAAGPRAIVSILVVT